MSCTFDNSVDVILTLRHYPIFVLLFGNKKTRIKLVEIVLILIENNFNNRETQDSMNHYRYLLRLTNFRATKGKI